MKAKKFLLQTICCILVFTATCDAQYNYPPISVFHSDSQSKGYRMSLQFRPVETPAEAGPWFVSSQTTLSATIWKAP